MNTAPRLVGSDDSGQLPRIAQAVGVATTFSGTGLVLAPNLVLRLLGARSAEPAPFLFRIIGMFMGVSGGLLTEGSRVHPASPVAMRWSLVAKIGAAVAVVSGVRSKRFGKQALALAAFDAGSAVLIAAIIARKD
jgi:hypothetical protein